MKQQKPQKLHRLSFDTSEQKKPSRLKAFASMFWKGFKRVCFTLGLFSLLSIFMWSFVAIQLTQPRAPISLPSKMVLYLNLEGPVSELAQDVNYLQPFSPPPLSLRRLIETLDAASGDSRVQELYVRLSDADLSLSQIQEFRAAVNRFKAAGKKTRIYASSYGEGAGGLRRMYLASVFDERWMQPLGIVGMSGFRIEMPFFRGALDKIGVRPDFYHREEYKTAYESFTNREMSAPNREAMSAVVTALKDAIMDDMPGDLKVTPAKLQAMVDEGLFTADEAIQLGLITRADYVDVLVDEMKDTYLGDRDSKAPLFVSFPAYQSDMTQKGLRFHAPKVALIYADGAIVDTNHSARNENAAADEIAPALLQVAKDKSYKAVILRINSPGGSPVASETILRAVQKVQKSGRPVIVSMGAVAASGGYWIATSADHIFALPTTLTGSIGVLGGKVSTGALWEKLSVNWDRSIAWGENSGMWSMNTPFSRSERVQVEKMLDNVYSAFLTRVADGRGMSLEDADTVARGRVWPGKLAKEKGLIDEIGGLHEAIVYTADLLGADSAQKLNLVQLPKPLSPLEQFVKLLEEQGMVFEGLRLQGKVMQHFAPGIEAMDAFSINAAEPSAVYAPFLEEAVR